MRAKKANVRRMTTQRGTATITPIRKHGFDLFQVRINGRADSVWWSEQRAVMRVQEIILEMRRKAG
jgi:hypothetical protein